MHTNDIPPFPLEPLPLIPPETLLMKQLQCIHQYEYSLNVQYNYPSGRIMIMDFDWYTEYKGSFAVRFHGENVEYYIKM